MSDNLHHSSFPLEPYTGTMQQYPCLDRMVMIVQAADSSGRLVKLEPVHEANHSTRVVASGLNAHTISQLPPEGLTAELDVAQTEEDTRPRRAGRVSLDAGLLHRLLVGIREARAELSDLRQRQRYGGRSYISEPPQYGDSV
ncbi:hypothetical protein PENSPDRAFT_325293 [Peniophora sp. CONT]|nr:hypothetical protein PENSPDRAFT_325293 [Peniophora sp. CONT]